MLPDRKSIRQMKNSSLVIDDQTFDDIPYYVKNTHKPDDEKAGMPIAARKDIGYTYNKKYHKKSINIFAGEYLVSDEDIIIGTVLGSCISVCLFSGNSSYCGMNHFMLPERGVKYKDENDIMRTDSAFYGIHSMEMLINTLMKVGVKKSMLKAKVFGGGNVLKMRSGEKTVGEQNIDFAVKFLEMENIPVVSCSVGGDYARKIYFFTKNQEVLQWHLGQNVEKLIVSEERKHRYEKSINKEISFFENTFGS